MIESAIANSPPPPIPWNARARISSVIDCAIPDSAEPATKMPIAAWKISRRP
jgi:hypothetical protein